MHIAIEGTVLSKRRKADGSVHFAVRPTKVSGTPAVRTPLDPEIQEARCSTFPTDRNYQLIASSSVVVYPQSSLVDFMSLIIGGSVVEGYGEVVGCVVDSDRALAADGGRIHVHMVRLNLSRVAPLPASISAVVEFSKLVTLNSIEDEWARWKPVLNKLIRPSSHFLKHHVTAETGAPDYLSDLASGAITLKHHCHRMSEYSFQSNTRNEPRKSVQSIGEFRRPPRERTRKLNFKEREILGAIEASVSALVAEASAKAALSLSCLDEVETQGGASVSDAVGSKEDISLEKGDSALLNIPDADERIPSARGELTRGEYLHGKKEPQVAWILNKLFGQIITEKRIGQVYHILDVGGGRGDLSVRIAIELKRRRLEGSSVTIVDRNSQSLRAGAQFAERMGVASIMEFVDEDFIDFSDRDRPTREVQLVVVALHACGSLTDLALGYAEKHHAAFVCVPCCFSKISINCPVESEVERPGSDWLSVLSRSFPVWHDAPEGGLERAALLCKMAEREPREGSWRAMKAINTIRLCSIVLGVPNDKGLPSWTLSLESFSRNFSMRNMALCGYCT